MPLNESYSYYIVQKTINKDRKITKKYPKGQSLSDIGTEGKFSTMFDRVRVCTLCFRIYKELENYYFKELRRNMSGSQVGNGGSNENMEGEDTERLMNREVKNDKDESDPRQKVDRALNGLFSQVKKNMDKFSDMTRTGSAGNIKLDKGLLFKTLDPKSLNKPLTEANSEPKLGGLNSGKSNKKSETKLPPIVKKSQGGNVNSSSMKV